MGDPGRWAHPTRMTHLPHGEGEGLSGKGRRREQCVVHVHQRLYGAHVCV